MSKKAKWLIIGAVAMILACALIIPPAISKTIADDEQSEEGFYGFDMSAAADVAVKAIASEGELTTQKMDSGMTHYIGSNQLVVSVLSATADEEYVVILSTSKELPDEAGEILYIDQKTGEGGALDFVVYPTKPEKSEKLYLFITSTDVNFETKSVGLGYQINEKAQESESTTEKPTTRATESTPEPTQKPTTRATEAAPTTTTKAPETVTRAPETVKPSDTSGNSGTANNKLFPDVSDPSKPYFKPVYWGVNRGIIQGYKNGNFGPADSCTRSQFVTMIWRFAGRPTGTSNVNFSDVNSSMSAYKAIRWAVSEGIIVGYKDGTFRPNANVTRRQVAVMLWRWQNKPTASKTAPFADLLTSDSAYKAIQWGAEAGVIKGSKSNGQTVFKPDDLCQRQQIVTFLYRFARDVLGEKVN